ncbi:sugar transferase [Roseibacillus persicicus]|uniref:sugar transferase n=1 Tax=Roseibacillus persicicus TaxID=454148 RepID=UPI00280DA97A|nr:sugar transferase [Roseibacillus persicicus]MDQ8190608.1 sugar transferase [Roseibacillus persicicus]
MVSNRESNLYQAHIIGQAIIIVALYFLVLALVLGVAYEQAIPLVSYLKYLGVIFGAFLFEAVGRPGHLRFAMSQSRRVAWRVTVRQASVMSIALLVFLVFSRDMRISRGFLAIYTIAALVAVFLTNRFVFRKMIDYLTKRSASWSLRTVVLGPEEWSDSVIAKMTRSNCAFSVDHVIHIGRYATVEEIREKLDGLPVDLLVASAYHLRPEVSAYLISRGERRGYRTWLPLELSRCKDRKFVVEKVGDIQMLTPPPTPLENTFNVFAKSVFDKTVALFVVLFVLPPMIVFVWVLQRIYSPGPLFFVQERVGAYNQTFKIFKFRSMKVLNDDEARQATSDDDRFYPGAGLLRKTSIDEFPQFLNVLMGQMSVVGPRPHMLKHEDDFQEHFERYGVRRSVKPGVTGLAQVKGFRGEINDSKDIRNRARHDILYIKSWSFSLDLRIILGTLLSVVKPHSTAY